MENKEIVISKTLRSMARSEGMCDRFFSEWEDDTTVGGLVEKFIAGFDFCVERNFPPLSFIRENFDTADLHRHHIYIDEEVDIDDAGSGFWVFLGKCKCSLSFDGSYAATVYVRHDSNVRISAANGAVVFVTAFDNGKVKVVQDKSSKVWKYNRRSAEIDRETP